MKDLIERQAAIDALGEQGLITAMVVIDRLPSVQPTYTDAAIQKMQDLHQAEIEKAFELGREDAKPHWIPVTERLPEPRTDVWVNSDIGQIQGYYEESVETWYASFGQGRDYLELIVNAWMPLPEPYREEGKQE